MTCAFNEMGEEQTTYYLHASVVWYSCRLKRSSWITSAHSSLSQSLHSLAGVCWARGSRSVALGGARRRAARRARDVMPRHTAAPAAREPRPERAGPPPPPAPRCARTRCHRSLLSARLLHSSACLVLYTCLTNVLANTQSTSELEPLFF